MKYLFLLLVMLYSSIQASDSFKQWFEDGTVKGDVRYYYIETKKDKADGSHSSAHANAVGGQLNYTTGSWNGFQSGVTFMTTNGFALPSSVDTSILGRDNGVRLENDASGEIAQDSFSVLGEAFIKYSYKDFNALYGRKVIKTPLMDAKDVRMLPSAVQGVFVDYTLECGTVAGASYLTHFKQRTSSVFTNIVKHALGDQTISVTGNDKGEVIAVDAVYKDEIASFQVYDYYAADFINSLYIDAAYKNKFGSGFGYTVSGQYINIRSVGNAETNLAQSGSATGGKKISSNLLGWKMDISYDESALALSYSKVLSDGDRHDSLVLPWDGTPLYTNMITSNDLFQSNYGKALNADSIYIGGSEGIKLAYVQKYDFTGVQGFKTVFSYLYADNDKFAHPQRDYNAVIAYGTGDFSLALKGIWVRNNSSQSFSPTGVETVSQDNKLTQYRVIANYRF